MGRWFAVAAVVSLLVVGPGSARPARAVLLANDVIPAATLLYPYFEADTADPNGVTTLLSLQNASATAILGRWTFWTELGIPTLSFDTYLTGFDMVTVNVRDIFAGGNLPVTASAGQDPTDTISNHGPFSQDINFASCGVSAIDPFPFANPILTGARLTDLQAAHQGLESPTYLGVGKCGASSHGDQIARGYVTVDTVNSCLQEIDGVKNPSTANYWNNFVATTQNTMLGDFFLIDPAHNRMEAETAVHVEADQTVLNTPGTFTFYGGLNSVAGGATDFREPVGGTWAASYEGGRSDLVVWRDPERDTLPFNCGSPLPFQYPLGQNQVVAFDMESLGTPLITGKPFPYRTNLTSIGPAPGLDFPAKQGWAYLNLNTSVGGQRFGTKQSWVMVRRRIEGGDVMSAGWKAVQLGSAAMGDDDLLVPNP
jgi:hypothetical protein